MISSLSSRSASGMSTDNGRVFSDTDVSFPALVRRFLLILLPKLQKKGHPDRTALYIQNAGSDLYDFKFFVETLKIALLTSVLGLSTKLLLTVRAQFSNLFK